MVSYVVTLVEWPDLLIDTLNSERYLSLLNNRFIPELRIHSVDVHNV